MWKALRAGLFAVGALAVLAVCLLAQAVNPRCPLCNARGPCRHDGM